MVQRYADQVALDNQVPAPETGETVVLTATGLVQFFDGSVWVVLANTDQLNPSQFRGLNRGITLANTDITAGFDQIGAIMNLGNAMEGLSVFVTATYLGSVLSSTSVDSGGRSRVEISGDGGSTWKVGLDPWWGSVAPGRRANIGSSAFYDSAADGAITSDGVRVRAMGLNANGSPSIAFENGTLVAVCMPTSGVS